VASSAQDRLALFYENYQTAFTNRAADLKAATTAVEVERIMANVDALETAYLDAARQALDATGADIESAYQEALAATQAVERAYQQGKALAARIEAVAGAVTAVGTLLTKAAGAAA
jgi:hypothetical protein